MLSGYGLSALVVSLLYAALGVTSRESLRGFFLLLAAWQGAAYTGSALLLRRLCPIEAVEAREQSEYHGDEGGSLGRRECQAENTSMSDEVQLIGDDAAQVNKRMDQSDVSCNLSCDCLCNTSWNMSYNIPLTARRCRQHRRMRGCMPHSPNLRKC